MFSLLFTTHLTDDDINIPDAGTITFTKHWFGMYIYNWFWYENYIYMGG